MDEQPIYRSSTIRITLEEEEEEETATKLIAVHTLTAPDRAAKPPNQCTIIRANIAHNQHNCEGRGLGRMDSRSSWH